jgi:S-adenosylmethionine uptake transporter
MKPNSNTIILLLALASHIAGSAANVAGRVAVPAIGSGAVTFLHFATATILIFILWLTVGKAAVPRGNLRIHLVRGIIIAGASVCHYKAISLMPLAQATALTFLAPIIAQPIGAVRLGERPSSHDIKAICIGTFGILIAASPSFIAEGPRLEGVPWAIASAIGIAANMVLLRENVSKDGVLSTILIASGIATLLLSPYAFSVTREAAIPVISAGFLGTLAAILIALAFGMGTLAHISRLEYAKIPIAIAFGWVSAGEPFELLVVIGGCIAIAACQSKSWRLPTFRKMTVT